jgi:quinol monooxygenase YgiN
MQLYVVRNVFFFSPIYPILFNFIQNLYSMTTNRRNFLKYASGAALLATILPASSILISCKLKPKKMSKNSLKVVAIAETSSERADELKSICLGLIAPTRKEEGCISYDLYQDTTNPGRFTFIEEWQSKDHLDVHLKTPHLVSAGEAFGKILTKELVILMLNKLA